MRSIDWKILIRYGYYLFVTSQRSRANSSIFIRDYERTVVVLIGRVVNLCIHSSQTPVGPLFRDFSVPRRKRTMFASPGFGSTSR